MTPCPARGLSGGDRNDRTSRAAGLFIWTGAALFVGSLAACAYAFAFVWAPAADAAWSRPAVLTNTMLFAVFALHHSVFAREVVKRRVLTLVPVALLRSTYVWAASLLLIALVGLWRPVGGELYTAAGPRRAAHLLVQLAGVWLIARSVATIDPLDLAGIRTAPPAERLQITGPYRLVRHPLYLGWILIVFGTAHMTGDRLLFAALSAIYLAAAIPWEERSLERAFGAEYGRYRQAVRWRMIPYVY